MQVIARFTDRRIADRYARTRTHLGYAPARNNIEKVVARVTSPARLYSVSKEKTNMANKTVTLTIGTDPSVLGNAATREDLDQWARNVSEAVRAQFGVETLLVRGSTYRSVSCDDYQIDQELQAMCAGDDWMLFL